MLLILQTTMQSYCKYFIDEDNQKPRDGATYVGDATGTLNHFSDSNLFYYPMELNSLTLEYLLGYYATIDV